MSRKKKILLVLLAVPLVPAGLLAAVLLVLWAWYHSIVSQTPGLLAVDQTPGVYGSDVNVFSGTGGVFYVCANNSPCATVPFGMVRLAPDTASILIDRPVLNKSGYYYGDNKILGFSHTRLVGAGVDEGGHFRMLPASEKRAAKLREEPFTPFSHSEETAFPGYYAVRLPEESVLAEMTATPRTGVHRYTFDAGVRPHLLIDVTSTLGDRKVEDGIVIIHPDRQEIEGSARTFGAFGGRYGGLDLFFVARFSQPFEEWGIQNNAVFSAGEEDSAGNDIVVDLAFASESVPAIIEVRLGISSVSIRNARENLEKESAGHGFDEICRDATQAWDERLSTIRISGGTTEQQRIFYTALYRCFMMPSTFSDANGEYRGFDKEVHTAEDFTYYSDFSLWDTFRTLHPLFNLIARDEQRDMMVSLVEMAKAGGALPRWAAGYGYTNCMLGTPADIAVTEAWLKGIRGFDIETAYRSMRQLALEGRPEGCRFSGRGGLDSYLRLGYCASEKMSKAVARTLEYCWADHALSLLAAELGHEEDAAIFADHARNYRNQWNPETRYFHPRDSSGVFQAEFDPLQLSYTDFDGKYTDDYCEGSALQWRWMVPHDPEGLIALFGGREYFVSELERFFEGATPQKGAWHPGSYYWHGNEPDLHSAYLFNAAGRPDRTQKWVRWLLDTRYGDDYVGLDGNDDCGTLSAWYVLSALGFYPVAGTDRYELGAPLFEKAVVRMGDARLEIIAENYAPENSYVRQVSLNGKVLDRTWFRHQEIAEGGELRFEMTPAVQAEFDTIRTEAG
jgi:predicted alpha-1,2-mannosidase